MQKLIGQLFEYQIQGLCSNCALVQHCVYAKTTDKIIVHCELYESNEAADGTQQGPAQGSLCMNCLNIELCHLPQKQNGIWHCEAYL